MQIGKIYKYANISYIFPYVFAMFAASASTINGGGLRPPPQQWGAAFGGPPIVVESIMVDAEAANIAKT